MEKFLGKSLNRFYLSQDGQNPYSCLWLGHLILCWKNAIVVIQANEDKTGHLFSEYFSWELAQDHDSEEDDFDNDENSSFEKEKSGK